MLKIRIMKNYVRNNDNNAKNYVKITVIMENYGKNRYNNAITDVRTDAIKMQKKC